MIRTATNAHFPQVLSALSLPEQGSQAEQAVKAQWAILQAVDGPAALAVMRNVPAVGAALSGFSDEDVLGAIDKLKGGEVAELPVKLVELDALLAQPEGYEDDVPINPDFHARRLPPEIWRSPPLTDSIASVIQLHRLREVLALIGFTRFEAEVPDINGEFDTDVTRAELAIEPKWFPAVENHGEGLFVQLDSDAVLDWLERPQVRVRLDQLVAGHVRWAALRKVDRPFPGGPYVLLHTLSHLLIGAVAMRCGYPASSIRERIYVDYEARRFAVLLYTASPDAEGTLGGLVGQARHIAAHLARRSARRRALLQRPRLRPARPRRGDGGALAARSLVPRLHTDRRDLVRDAQRLPRPRARRANAGRPGRRVLPRAAVIEALRVLPAHLRSRLQQALSTSMLAAPYSTAAVRSALGGGVDDVEAIHHALDALDAHGVSAAAIALVLEAAAPTGTARPDLVWSGPTAPGLHTRNTRQVYDELIATAERSIWISTFAYFDGQHAFKSLADRMTAIPGLQVRIMLNIQRRHGDATAAEELMAQFAHRFWSKDWPGERRPAVYYDPRSLEPDGPEGVLHAKAVVADERTALVTSANLTEAAFDRNIEVGILTRDQLLAASLVRHFRILIDHGRLLSLDGS